MTARLLPALIVVTGVLMGCGKNSAPPAASTATPEAAPASTANTGTPQLVDSFDGVHVQYRVYGSGEPAVVLVHGWSCDSQYWQRQIDALKAKYTVVTVDLAGHGASGRNRAQWTIANYGDDVASVVRRLPNRTAVLVGHSMGGPVILAAASRLAPSGEPRIIGLVGVDTMKGIGMPPPPPAQIDGFLARFRADFIGTTREFVTKTFFQPDADPAFVRKIADDMSLQPPEIAIPSMVSLNEFDYTAAVRDITVPIVAINSDLHEPADEARIRKVAPTFRAVVVPHTGHFLMMESPDRFNPILLQQIEELARP